MNASLNETWLWYCDICDKTINIKSKSKHIISKSHKHKDTYGVLVKQNDFIRPDIQNIDSIIDIGIRDCHKKYFHTIEHKWIHYINFKNITNNDIISLIVAGKQMNLYGLNKNVNIARENGFTINQLNKLTIKVYSSLSTIIIC